MKNTSSIKRELKALNQQLHSRELLGSKFINQLKLVGIDFSKSVLVNIFPDGNNTYCGVIISQEKKVFQFDIDLDNSKYSVWTDVTDEFMRKLNNAKKYSRENLAYELFQDMAI